MLRVAPLFLSATLALAAARIAVHGHRGARGTRPENTMAAFRYAISLGVDVLELDLAVTQDDVVVVSHDPHVNPVICQGPKPGAAIRQLSFAELRAYDCGSRRHPDFPKQQPVPGERIPSLDEVLSLAREGAREFNIETKIFPDHPELTPTPERFVDLILAQVRRHGLQERVILQSFDYRTLHAMKRLEPRIRRAALFESDVRDFVVIAREAEAGIVSPHYSLVTREKVQRAHQAGLPVVPWTANRAADWAWLVEAGVDGIITDYPAELLAWLQARGLR